MAKESYIPEMQVARGIGILLVTIGHSEPIKTVFPHLFDIIYSFHMPLFFFLSGFFSTKLMSVGSFREWMRVVPVRLVYLVIPYITISVCYASLKYFVPQLTIRPVIPEELLLAIFIYPTKNPALFLWFLYTIIIMQAFTPILNRINQYLMLAILFALQVLQPDVDLFGIGLLLHYTMYYYLGMRASSMRNQFLYALKKKKAWVVSLGIFAVGYLVWKKTDIPVIQFLVALSGTAFVLSICFCYIQNLPKRLLETFGQYSFSIYLLQYFFIFPLYFFLTSLSLRGELIVPCTFSAGILGPLFLVYYIFPHSKTLSLLFSGIGRSKKTS
jgi:fucose 4-O-acetylase-like acetyltransferase